MADMKKDLKNCNSVSLATYFKQKSSEILRRTLLSPEVFY